MELNVLGCWAAYPAAGQACSGYMVKDKNTRILLDCGHAVFSKLSQLDNFIDLDAVYISHFHPDHYVDLYALRHAVRASIYLGKRKQPLQVYMPGEPAGMIDKWLQFPELEVTRVQKDMEIKVGEFDLSFYPTCHPVPGLAVKLTAGSRSLFYTGDTSFDEKLVTASRRVNVLLAESTMSDAEQEYAVARGHMTTKDVAEWAGRSEPDLLVATHLWDGYKQGDVEKELNSHCKTKFIMAYEGLKLTI